MEKIVSISELDYKDESNRGYDGYAITTDKQVIKLMIDNGQACCESWGYFMSEDDLSGFIGADLIGLSLTNTALEKVELNHAEEINGEETSVMFVNIETSAGLLQFVAHNTHNGYYGHGAYVRSIQLSHEETL